MGHAIPLQLGLLYLHSSIMADALEALGIRVVVKNTFIQYVKDADDSPICRTKRRRSAPWDIQYSTQSELVVRCDLVATSSDCSARDPTPRKQQEVCSPYPSESFEPPESDWCLTGSGSSAGTERNFGSDMHAYGLCRPCVWFWRPEGCAKGTSCEYCHVCDKGAVVRAAALRRAAQRDRKMNEVRRPVTNGR